MIFLYRRQLRCNGKVRPLRAFAFTLTGYIGFGTGKLNEVTRKKEMQGKDPAFLSIGDAKLAVMCTPSCIQGAFWDSP
jgi:hypothetical protein